MKFKLYYKEKFNNFFNFFFFDNITRVKLEKGKKENKNFPN